MTQLDLGFGELRFSITLLGREVEVPGMPYLDWLICEVSVEVPAFSGRFRCNLMPADLEELAKGLSDLHAQVPTPGRFAFQSSETNISLSFGLTPTGSIEGTYRFCPSSFESTGLSGDFSIDQSFLPGLAAQIRAFVRASKDAA